MISASTIDKIYSIIRVEEIIGEYVQLKRAGSNLKGLSPFHNEKTPSFVVSPSKQIWKDFSSGKGGNAISFLMEIENFTYPEALRHVANKYSIEVEEDKKELTQKEKENQTQKELLYKIHEVANTYFQNNLHETYEGKTIGLSYFKERGLREDIIQKFQLGYSTEQKNAFTETAQNKNYSKELLEKSGLSIYPENSPNGIDRFRERVTFPIHSFSGRVVGFGARILKNNLKVAKYLNSPETEIYHKSNILYGLYQGKQAISKSNLCLLVEGYMDVIALHQAGIENVVASSGTSLTTEQIKLIKRLTENVTILFDGDAAGIKASFRSIDMLLSEGMNIRIVLFPDGDDPDSFARKYPKSYLENFIQKEAKDFIDFKAEILLKETAEDPIKKSEAIQDIVKSIALISNPIKKEIYQKQISEKFGLKEESISKELSAQELLVKEKPTQKETNIENPSVKTINPLQLSEDRLISLLLKYSQNLITIKNEQISVAEYIIQLFQEDEYKILCPINRKIAGEFYKGINNGEILTEAHFTQHENIALTSKIADILLSNETEKESIAGIHFYTEEEQLSKIIYDTMLVFKSQLTERFIIENIRNKNKETIPNVARLLSIKKQIQKELLTA